jgi:hypothetical protein
MMQIQAFFLSCGLVMLGLIVSAAGLLAVQPALRSARWRATQGEVLAGLPGSDSLRYRYTVKGKTYTAARVAFYSGAIRAFAAPPPGSPVTVYYDPTAPDRAVLQPGAGPLAYLPIAAGGLLFVLGLLSSLLALAGS